MQTTNDTRNSVKEKPKATSGCEGDDADPTCSGGEVSDERQGDGRGVAGLLAAAAGSDRAVARSSVAGRAGQGRGRAGAEHGRGGACRGGARSGVAGRDRCRWPSRAGAGCARAELGRGRACRGGARSGVAGRAAAGHGRAGPGRGARRAGAALAQGRRSRRTECSGAGPVRRWSRRVPGGGGGLAVKMGLEVNGFGEVKMVLEGGENIENGL
ncbi:hypothetical protein Syun_030237 [Stephania yunnanensis]|uniref:Uncharacterized protein n=1 Tax=Stephania yunnanensis TaxID=152371 RepID=A0AAP0EA52_9MAGN